MKKVEYFLALTLWTAAAGAQTAAPASPSAPAAAAAPKTTESGGNKAGNDKSAAVESRKRDLTQMPSAEQLRPSGPVTVTAKRAEMIQGNSAIYSGNVVLDSDTLKLDGDRLELKQFPDGEYEATVTGAPAHMSHAGAGPDNPPVAARASTLHYDSRSGMVDLIGDAWFMRSNDEITGKTIRYNVIERRVEASGGENGGQVRIVIQQPPSQKPSTPTATPPPASGATIPAPAPAAGTHP